MRTVKIGRESYKQNDLKTGYMVSLNHLTRDRRGSFMPWLLAPSGDPYFFWAEQDAKSAAVQFNRAWETGALTNVYSCRDIETCCRDELPHYELVVDSRDMDFGWYMKDWKKPCPEMEITLPYNCAVELHDVLKSRGWDGIVAVLGDDGYSGGVTELVNELGKFIDENKPREEVLERSDLPQYHLSPPRAKKEA